MAFIATTINETNALTLTHEFAVAVTLHVEYMCYALEYYVFFGCASLLFSCLFNFERVKLNTTKIKQASAVIVCLYVYV